MFVIGRMLWLLVKGSSTVTLDWEKGEAVKVYHPRLFVRLLHFLAFQKWTFLYETEIGLQLAGCRRKIAAYVLQCGGMEGRCQIAEFLCIERQGDKLAFVTRLIEGREPCRTEVLALLGELETLFLEAGVPTWSVSPHNPRAQTNFIVDGDRIPVIVDLESIMLNVCVPLEEIRANILARNFPPFDEIHFFKLWRFFWQNRNKLPDKGEEFQQCIERCEKLTGQVKSWQPRIWSRLLCFLLKVFRKGG